jgi:hypothetical protein
LWTKRALVAWSPRAVFVIALICVTSSLIARPALAVKVATKKEKQRSARAQFPVPGARSFPAPPLPTPAPPAQPGPPPAAALPGIGQDAPDTHDTPDVANQPGPADDAPVDAAPAAAVAPEKPWPEWINHIALGGGAIIYHYQPLDTAQKPNLELFFAYLLVDGKLDGKLGATPGHIGLHFEPRFRDTRLRPFFDAPFWLEEAYAWADVGPLMFKAGKIYSRLGLFWDNSFYGNVQLFDGLKLDPDQGVTVEGTFGRARGITLAAQYFVVDGRTNLSLEGRDTISIPLARRRNMMVVRVDPFTQLGTSGQARLGLSAEHLTADLPDGAHAVNRLAADVTIALRGARVWGEWLYQRGQTVSDFPYAAVAATDTTPAIPGRPSVRNIYWLAGGEYSRSRVTARYNFSRVHYTTVDVVERTHVIGLGISLRPNLILLEELVFWNRDTPGTQGTLVLDRSLNLTLTGHF